MTFGFKGLGTALAAATLVIAPTAASAAANPAASLSLSKATRSGTPAKGSSTLAEGPTATYVSIGILAALVGIVLVATGGSDSSDSN